MPFLDKEKVGLWDKVWVRFLDKVSVRFLDKVWVRFLERGPLNLEVGWFSRKT